MHRSDVIVLHTARSLLFLPASRLDRLPKALSSGAHAVILDLEDAVAPSDKEACRAALMEHWPAVAPEARRRIAVRINAATSSWHEADASMVGELSRLGLGGIMLPKAEEPSVLRQLHGVAPGVPLVPLVESARGVAALDLLAKAPHVARLAFGHLDFQLDLGMQCDDEERELDSTRMAMVSASRIAGIAPPIDGVTLALAEEARCRADAIRSLRFGFGAKLCIHPSQVPAVNQAFAPTPAQLQWASRVAEAADRERGAAFSLDGQMVDAPLIKRAMAYLAARRADDHLDTGAGTFPKNSES
jgi:citrate lyase subunit beta/citryl-CoA lyase